MDNLELNSLSLDNIRGILLPDILNVTKKYAYLEVTEDEVEEIIDKMIIFCIEKYFDKPLYPGMILRRIDAGIRTIGRTYINDIEKTLDITNAYINSYFILPTRYDEAINILKTFDNLLSSYDCMPTPDVLIKLLNKNEIFNKTLELIINKNLEFIQKGKSSLLFNSSTINSMIDIYCMVNNIEIKKEKKEKESQEKKDNEPNNLGFSYFKTIARNSLIKSDEITDIIVRAQSGDNEAINRLIEGNLRLVRSISIEVAKTYGLFSNSTISIDDLDQEGILGLMRAIDKFDVSLGYQFSTYATFWIRRNMIRWIKNNHRTIRISEGKIDKLFIYQKVKESLTRVYGDDIKYIDIANNSEYTLDQVIEYEKLLQGEPLSLNYNSGLEGNKEFINYCHNGYNLQLVAEKELLVDDVKKLIDICGLTKRERDVLSLRLGLYDHKTRSLETIGKILNCTREAVRQREAKGLSKLRINPYTEQFALYMDNPDEAVERLARFKSAYSIDENKKYKYNPLDDEEIVDIRDLVRR